MGLIAETLNRYAQSQTVTFKHDRKQTVGASEIGQCARKVFWLKNEDDPEYAVPRDPEYTETWGARMRGTVFENAFLGAGDAGAVRRTAAASPARTSAPSTKGFSPQRRTA